MAKLYITQDNVQNAFLLKGKQVLGRPSSNFTPDIPVSSKMVSRMHGEFITNENGCYYRDLGSSNGTILNGVSIEPQKYYPFKAGDVLSIHDITLRYADEPAPVARGASIPPRTSTPVRTASTPVRTASTPVRTASTPARTASTPARTASSSTANTAPKVLSIHIEERSVTSHFKKITLLKNIHINIKNHSMVLILGGSGAGKTTFMNAVMGYEPAKGQIIYNNINIYNEYEKMKHQIGYVPQQDLLRMNDTVYDTLYGAAQMRLPATLSEDDLQRRVFATMKMLGLEREQNSLVVKLSGGQRKRLSIAVEYIANPSLFFLDEPDSGLDGIMARELMENLRRIADDGRIVMVISHSPDRAFELFDQVIVLAKDSRDNCGHLVFSGSPNQACSFFNVQSLEGIVKKINRQDEGGEGMADFFISKYERMVNHNE